MGAAVLVSSTVYQMPGQPTITVITATTLREDRLNYLEQLHGSLDSQELTRGLLWEWVVALDGLPQSAAPNHLRRDRRVRVISARKGGSAATRNHALAEASSPLSCCVDDDDLLPPKSLAIRFENLQRFPTHSWVAGGWENLHPDGSRDTWRYPAVPGPYQPGDVWRTWAHPMATTPFGHQAMLMRTDTLRRVGGWQALVQGEDLGMLVALTGETYGSVIEDVVYWYRFHARRTMTTPEHIRDDEFYRTVAWERGRLVAQVSKSHIGTPPAPRRNDGTDDAGVAL